MLLGLILSALVAQAQPFDSAFYHARYGLPDVYTKKTNNHGNGHEDLYGTRNFREVLKGVFYRGGANNHWHRTDKRNNSNPLPDDGLQNLCEEGFGKAVYLYTTNFNTAPPLVNCNSIRGHNRLDYLQISPLSKPKEILALVHAAILDPANGPVYAHCWNGWHASGLIAALALRQFCGISGAAGVAYWEANIDGHDDPAYAKIKQRIRDYTYDAAMPIDAATRARICPTLF